MHLMKTKIIVQDALMILSMPPSKYSPLLQFFGRTLNFTYSYLLLLSKCTTSNNVVNI